MCITDSLFNNYFEDIEDVLYNTERYPRSDYDKPYVDYFTDLVQRTDQYSDIATNDGSIQTEYVQMDYNGNRIFFFATGKVINNELSYDLAIYIEPNE